MSTKQLNPCCNSYKQLFLHKFLFSSCILLYWLMISTEYALMALLHCPTRTMVDPETMAKNWVHGMPVHGRALSTHTITHLLYSHLGATPPACHVTNKLQSPLSCRRSHSSKGLLLYVIKHWHWRVLPKNVK